MSADKSLVRPTVFISVTILFVGMVSSCLAAPPKDDPRASEPDEEGAYTYDITVTGRARDAAGEPIAGATIYLASPRTNGRPIAETKTDAKGQYQFKGAPLPIEPPRNSPGRESGAFEVFGTADGYALAWRPLKWFNPSVAIVGDEPNWQPPMDTPTRFGRDDKIKLDLKFGPPASFRGRVVDDSGDPIAGVGLRIRAVAPDWSRERFLYSSPTELESLNERAIVPPSVKSRTTDGEGDFEFTELPQGARFRIDVRPPGRPSRSIYVVTDEIDFDEIEGHKVYTTEFELVFAKSKPVTIRVTYGDSGKPASEVFVDASSSGGGQWKSSNEAGEVSLMIPPGEYKLHMMPRTGTPYLRTDSTFTVSSEERTNPIEATLDPAAIVEVTVLSAATGIPLEGVDLWVEKTTDSGRVYRESLGYRSWTPPNISHYERPKTNQRGVVRALFPPGMHHIGIAKSSYPEGYIPVQSEGQTIQCKAGEVTKLEFTMKVRGE